MSPQIQELQTWLREKGIETKSLAFFHVGLEIILGQFLCAIKDGAKFYDCPIPGSINFVQNPLRYIRMQQMTRDGVLSVTSTIIEMDPSPCTLLQLVPQMVMNLSDQPEELQTAVLEMLRSFIEMRIKMNAKQAGIIVDVR